MFCCERLLYLWNKLGTTLTFLWQHHYQQNYVRLSAMEASDAFIIIIHKLLPKCTFHYCTYNISLAISTSNCELYTNKVSLWIWKIVLWNLPRHFNVLKICSCKFRMIFVRIFRCFDWFGWRNYLQIITYFNTYNVKTFLMQNHLYPYVPSKFIYCFGPNEHHLIHLRSVM